MPTIVIPNQNLAVFLQKFSLSTLDATTFDSNYASVGVVTTNKPGARQWQFTFDGAFSTKQAFQIIYDFSKVDTYGYFIVFEGVLNGFMNIDGTLYAVTKYLKYIPQTQEDIDNKIIRFLFKPPCWKDNVDVVRKLYYVTNLNDTSCTCTTTDSSITKNPGIVLNMNNLSYTNTYTNIVNVSVTSSGGNVVEAYVDVVQQTSENILVMAENISDGALVEITNLVEGSTINVYLWTSGHNYYCTIGPNTQIIYTWDGGCWIQYS